MKLILPALVTLSLALVPAAVGAKPGNGRGNGHGARAEQGSCPPGLAKRDPACIPPGQVGRGDREDHVERRQPEVVTDREDAERDARTELPELDPMTAIMELLDEIPVRNVVPSDAAALDVPLEPAPVRRPVVQQVVPRAADLDGASADAALEPSAGTESELGDVFRRATAEGSVGY